MSKKDLQKDLEKEAIEPSIVHSEPQQENEAEPPLFYRCVCPECGEDAFHVIDSGVYTSSPVFGITGDGEVGCSHTELDGGYELGIYCRDCGHQACSDDSFTEKCGYEFLAEWAKSNGVARTKLPFDCPECDSQELNKVEIGIEFSTAVVAVCESDSADAHPIVAVSHIRDIDHRGSYRYRCSRGHEIAKDDGSPVETPEELVGWLKSRPAIDKG
jgi:hypothetical protein